jgi:serine-type D-Ala-D-Ala carboxypeptidase/endopeptidase (penicillin-binding protein 4)
MQIPQIFIYLLAPLIICSCKARENAASASSVDSIVAQFIASKNLQHATVAIQVVDLDSDELLVSHNEALTMLPASLIKIVTTATALEVFSPDHSFKTTLEHTGFIDEEGRLQGDLRISGGGDPALGSAEFRAHYGDVIERFAEAVQKSGIKIINGSVVGDGSCFGRIAIPDTWFWEDIGNYYGATATGLNIYDNSYEITFRTESLPGTPAVITQISPSIPGLEFENRVMAADNNHDLAYIYGTYLSNKRIVSGTIPKGRRSFTIRGAVPDPAFLAAYRLSVNLEAAGIKISGEPVSSYRTGKPAKKTIIDQIHSPPISALIDLVNKKSQNLYAETLLLHLSQIQGTSTQENGCKVIKQFWEDAAMPVGGMFLLDGSGLSRANGMTAGQIVFILRYMRNQSQQYALFRQSLPMAGVSGNLVNFGNGTLLEGNLQAKSGTMSRVMNYCGYLQTASGREIAFAVLVNNYEGTPPGTRSMITELLQGIAAAF